MKTFITIEKKWIIVALAVFILGGVLLGTTIFTGLPEKINEAIEVTESQGRLVPIYYVETPEKKVALSFDATWGAERTPQILDILDEYEIKTTYFVTGIWGEEYPEWIKEIAERGHEIGNHTSSHPNLSQLSAEQIEEELQAVEDMVYSLTEKRTRLFRPPFGDYDNNVINTADNMGYKTIQWSIDSLDWKNLSPEEITDRIKNRAHNGAIILLHNDALHTPEALPQIIEFFQEQDYEIVPISQLLYHQNYTIDPHSGAQKPKR